MYHVFYSTEKNEKYNKYIMEQRKYNTIGQWYTLFQKLIRKDDTCYKYNSQI